ncbi:MAG: L-histidine N(alpha)-methyltransferase [Paludibacter sp.]|nr:L-histidine N(alpha)-methyltransferase [Paludibacter sp.]
MEKQTLLSELANDTLYGLISKPKYLLSKYFYDDIGSSIFQDIMKMPEYYLTDCEYEIFDTYKTQIIDEIIKNNTLFDLIELGSGDGLKTKVLLNALIGRLINFRYVPIDISLKANIDLEKSLMYEIPSLKVKTQTGDFFRVMKNMNGYSGLSKVILFLGSNIGNFTDDEISLFLENLSEFTHSGDRVMIGFDLKKSPELINQAYNDPHGHTCRFNLNHLARLNRELGANFYLENFEHHSEYNPQSGEVKSFLVSKKTQKVYIEALEENIQFYKWEAVFMELSRKFDFDTIEKYAANYGFSVVNHFTDKNEWFTDSLWIKK